MKSPQKAFILVPGFNTTKPDATGAFQPQARQFCRYHKLAPMVRQFDNTHPVAARRLEVNEALDNMVGANLDTVVLFCHGTRDGIQTGHRVQDAPDMAARLAKAVAPGVTVILYACDTGRDSDKNRVNDVIPGPGGKDGFASKLYQALLTQGVTGATLVAHSTPGHTTENPWARVWLDDGDPDLGDWLVEPHSRYWHTWCRLLRGPFAFRFPFLTEAELQTELASWDHVGRA